MEHESKLKHAPQHSVCACSLTARPTTAQYRTPYVQKRRIPLHLSCSSNVLLIERVARAQRLAPPVAAIYAFMMSEHATLGTAEVLSSTLLWHCCILVVYVLSTHHSMKV
eukprot:14284-Heterococcus_DN1.PRE.3